MIQLISAEKEMKIRLKIRDLLLYLCAVCCATVLDGTYFMFSSPLPSSKSRRGIDKAARDSWGNGAASLTIFPRQVRKPDLSSFLWSDGRPDPKQDQHGEQQAVQRQMVLPTKQQLQNMTWEDLSNLYHSYTQQIQVGCSNIERLGKVTDGGWEVCEDAPYRPASPCLVYSFGVGYDFSFDDAVAYKYGCEVHSFDPSMNVGAHKRVSTVQFHALGLADFTGQTEQGWKVSTLPQIKTDLGHTGPLSILKLDIEEWEWKVLPSLLKGGHLQDTRQLLVELHQCDGCSVFNPAQVDKEPPKERYVLALGSLRDLYNLGFRTFWHHQNPACKYISKFGLQERNACCELHMIRVDH